MIKFTRTVAWLTLFGVAIIARGFDGFSSPTVPVSQSSALASDQATTLSLGSLSSDVYYGVLVWTPDLKPMAGAERLRIAVDDAAGEIAAKTLHAGDPDFYLTLKPRKSGEARVRASLAGAAPGGEVDLKIQVAPMKIGNGARAIIAAQPNGDWRNAQPIELGRTVFGSGDDRPYIPITGSGEEQLKDLFAGAQWFTFTYAGPNPALVHFDVNTLDRDVPEDVMLFTREGEGADAKLVPYEEGIERFVPEKSMAFHGLYKLIARVVRPGTYYLRVMANHPDFQLRTKIYNPPPYDDPREAIRTGMDYLVKKGDSWHMNTPRRGGVIRRDSNPLQETSLCIACHPTHFTTRGELIAIGNGYPLRERTSMQFLTERLYNNPRPIYGKPDAAWVRMISAPGNVMSRLAYMLFTFEQTVTHEQREGLLDDIGNYLEMYWKELDYIHPESNGNLPRISGYEIALHNGLLFEELYRRTGKEKYKALREKMERLVLEGEVQDHIDLCWKAVALATFNKEKHAEELKKIAEEIFSRQRPDGTWAMPFGKEVYEHDYHKQQTSSRPAPLDADGNPVASEFQTYHCIYALAKCGVTMDDPRLAKSVKWCLAQQKPFGGWQGNKDYKNFDTPFRDTQYAVMALSELFPATEKEITNPGAKTGWMKGFDPAPESFDLEDTAATLDALDQYWEDPGPQTRALIRRALDHPQPLVRHAAASAAGRIADREAIPQLARLLGDPSKIIQRAAAWALRQIASRKGEGALAIQAALKSPDDRMRWGATRVFNQHFRYLADDWSIAEDLMREMRDDPVPSIRMAAAQTMAKWWYWERSDERKSRIEDRFILCMDRAENPYVRRNLVEGFHNLTDDNVSYLYNSWIRQLSAEEDRNCVTAAHHASVRRQADKIARALAEGNDFQREGILRSFYAFHLREAGGDEKSVASVPDPPFTTGDWLMGYRKYAAYDPLKEGTGVMARIGNDSDYPAYYGDSGPLMAAGIYAALKNASPELTLAALKAFKHTDGVQCDAPLSEKLIDLALAAPGDDAAAIQALAKELLPSRIENSPAVAARVKGLLESGGEGELKLAEAILTQERNTGLAADAAVDEALKIRILGSDPSASETPPLQNMLGRATPIQSDKAVVDKAFAVLLGGTSAGRQSAFRSMISSPKFLVSGPPRERFQAELNVADADVLLDMLKVAAKLDFAKLDNESSQNLALGIVTTGLARSEKEVRKQALASLRSLVAFQTNPSVLSQLRALAQDEDSVVRDSASGLLKSIEVRGKKASEQDVGAMLDYGYFVRYINPIFQAKGTDSEACAQCHVNHTVLKLNFESAEHPLSETELRENYLSALKVVDLNNPEDSLILIKPRMPFEGIELPGNYRKTHGGNVRWKEGKENEGYQTILRWIQGAKAETSVSQAP